MVAYRSKPQLTYTCRIYHENHEHILLLVIRDVQLEDSGLYTIMAENEIGFDSVDINLTVISIVWSTLTSYSLIYNVVSGQKYPAIKSKVEDLTIGIEETLIVSAEVDGIPKPDVQFLKEGREVEVSDHVEVVDNHPTYTLVLRNTTLKDTG